MGEALVTAVSQRTGRMEQWEIDDQGRLHPTGMDVDFLEGGIMEVTVTAGAAIIPDDAGDSIKEAKTLLLSAAGAVAVGTITTTPILPDGFNGQDITILNVGAEVITLTDQGTMAGSNLRLAAATIALAPMSSICLMFSTGVGDWLQTTALITPSPPG